MDKLIGNTVYTFNVKLGVTIKIKKAFNKTFNQVLEKIDKFDIEELIKLLYCGIDEKEHTKEEFTNDVLENVGLMELYDMVQLFIKKIQYPGLTEEEIDKKLIEKNQQTQQMQNMIGLKK